MLRAEMEEEEEKEDEDEEEEDNEEEDKEEEFQVEGEEERKRTVKGGRLEGRVRRGGARQQQQPLKQFMFVSTAGDKF